LFSSKNSFLARGGVIFAHVLSDREETETKEVALLMSFLLLFYCSVLILPNLLCQLLLCRSKAKQILSFSVEAERTPDAPLRLLRAIWKAGIKMQEKKKYKNMIGMHR
jgi:hypothetical protein